MKSFRFLILMIAAAIAGWAFSPGPRPDRVWLVALDAQGRETVNTVQSRRMNSRGPAFSTKTAALADSGRLMLVESQAYGPARIVISKVSPGKSPDWERTYRAPGLCRQIHRVSGGYIALGEIPPEVVATVKMPSLAASGLWAIGISESGDSLWSLRWEDPIEPPLQVVPQPDGSGVAIAANSYSGTESRLVLVIVSQTGHVEREVTLLGRGGQVSFDGGIHCGGLATMPNGDFLLAGTTWIMAANQQGEVYGFRQMDLFEGGSLETLAALSDGSYLLVGHSRVDDSTTRYWTAGKVYPDGELIWVKRYFPLDWNNTYGASNASFAALETKDHHYQLAGYGQSPGYMKGWLFTLSEHGDSLGNLRFEAGERGYFNQILPGPEGGVILVGAAYMPREE